MHINDSDELIHDILQEAWGKLLKNKDKIEFFDSLVPAQILCWVEDIWISQIEQLRIADPEALKRKQFSVVASYRYSIIDTVGMDYFLKEINDEEKMKALDEFTEKIREKLRSEEAMKRLYR